MAVYRLSQLSDENLDIFQKEKAKISDIIYKKLDEYKENNVDVDELLKHELTVAIKAIASGQRSFLSNILYADDKSESLRDANCAHALCICLCHGYNVNKLWDASFEKLEAFYNALREDKTNIYDYLNENDDKFIKISNLLRQGNTKEDIENILASETSKNLDTIIKDNEFGIENDITEDSIIIDDLDDFVF